MSAPSRQQVEHWWQAIIDGTLTREEVHSWAVRWVEDFEEVDPVEDPIASIGLQYLHGFDLSSLPATRNLVYHGIASGRVYLRTIADVARELERWQIDGQAFDKDPSAWRRDRFEALYRNLVQEGRLEQAGRVELILREIGDSG